MVSRSHMPLIILPILSMAACTRNVYEVAAPSKISLQQALQDVATSLVQLRDYERQNNIKLGVVIDEVNINFQLAANASNDTKLGVAVSAPSGAPVGGSISLGNENIIGGQRGSAIQIKLKNVITAPFNQAGCYYFIPNYMQSKKDCAAAKPSSDTSSTSSSKAVVRGTVGTDLSSQVAAQMQRELNRHHLPLRLADVAVR